MPVQPTSIQARKRWELQRSSICWRFETQVNVRCRSRYGHGRLPPRVGYLVTSQRCIHRRLHLIVETLLTTKPSRLFRGRCHVLRLLLTLLWRSYLKLLCRWGRWRWGHLLLLLSRLELLSGLGPAHCLQCLVSIHHL